jgi:hypothetical protein
MSTNPDHVEQLAAILREVDCDYSEGSAVLAQAILGHPGSAWHPPDNLAQPAGEGPTDEELLEAAAKALGYKSIPSDETCLTAEASELLAFAHAILARWGRPIPQPIPVSERLPGQGDCDAEGRCWLLTVEDDYPQWRLHSVEGAQPGGPMIWVPVDNDNGAMVDCFYTSHWLPHWALPLPQGEPTG